LPPRLEDKYSKHLLVIIMSLISQRDREVAIKALEMYAANAETSEYYLGTPHHSSSEIHALLNWVRLEYFKHGD